MYWMRNLGNGREIAPLNEEDLQRIRRTLEGKELTGHIYFMDRDTLPLLRKAGVKAEVIDAIKGEFSSPGGVDIGIYIRKETMEYAVRGRVERKGTGQPVVGVKVEGYDRDLLEDDFLGWSFTGERGEFEISYSEKDFNKPLEAFEGNPDLYLVVKNRFGTEIARTEVRREATRKEFFLIVI